MDLAHVREIFSTLVDVVNDVIRSFKRLSYLCFLQDPSARASDIQLIPIELIETAVYRGETLVLIHSERMACSDLCPDVAIAPFHSPRLTMSSLRVDERTVLGEGGFATVHSANFDGESVAVKVIKAPTEIVRQMGRVALK